MHERNWELEAALADAVERLLLAHAADVPDVGRSPCTLVLRRTQRLGAEESTRLLNRIQSLRRIESGTSGAVQAARAEA